MTDKELLASRHSIVQKLTQARLEKGLTQAQLAEQFGVSDRSVSRWETGVSQTKGY